MEAESLSIMTKSNSPCNMKAYARNGQEIKVGHKYLFEELCGGVVRTVTEIIDADAVRIDDHWRSSRWVCNAMFEMPQKAL